MAPRKKKARGRAPNGRSTFENLGNGHWRGRVSMGKDPVTKQPIRPSVSGTYDEVKKGVEALEAERDRAKRAGTSGMHVGEYLDHWLQYRLLLNGKESTYNNYESNVRLFLKPQLGDVPLRDLTYKQIELCLTRITRIKPIKGNPTPPELLPASADTKEAVLKTIRAALTRAIEEGLLDDNPASRVKAPKPSNKAVIVFEAEEVDLILQTAFNEFGALGLARVCIAILGGARQAEALGMRWSTTRQGEAYIHQSRPRRYWNHGCGAQPCGQKRKQDCPQRWRRPLLDDVKSEAGHRTIVLGAMTMEALRALKAQQARDRLAAGDLWGVRHNTKGVLEKDGYDWVFVDKMGCRLDHRRDAEMWQRIVKASGLNHLKLHGARHTGATFALASGVDEVTIMKQFGWSTRAMLKKYGHPGTTDQRRLADGIEGMIKGVGRRVQESAAQA